MKILENIAIRRKLASFRSVFPHDDNTTDKVLGGIYDDVLEFSRPVRRSQSNHDELIDSLLDSVYTPNP